MCGLSSPIWAGPSLLHPFVEFLATGERAAQPGAHRVPASGYFHPRFLPTFFSLSCSGLVPAVLCHAPVLLLSRFKGPSGVLGFPSAGSLSSGLLRPVRPLSPGWLSRLGSPGQRCSGGWGAGPRRTPLLSPPQLAFPQERRGPAHSLPRSAF